VWIGASLFLHPPQSFNMMTNCFTCFVIRIFRHLKMPYPISDSSRLRFLIDFKSECFLWF
jgi:hypothetical protein